MKERAGSPSSIRKRAAITTLIVGVVFLVGGPYGFIKSSHLADTAHDIASHVMFVLGCGSLALGALLSAIGIVALSRRRFTPLRRDADRNVHVADGEV